MSGDLTPDDVKHWDLSVIHQIFETAAKRRDSKHQLGEALANAQARTGDWHGESGDAFREELGKTRTDINAAGRESDRVFKAVQNAEMWVSGAKVELDDVEAAAETYGWTITPDWKISGGETDKTWIYDPLVLAAEQETLQADLDKAHQDALTADRDLATAIRASVGDAELDEHGHEIGGQHPQTPGQHTPDTVPGPHNGDPGYKTGLAPTLAGSPGDHPPMHVAAGSSDQVRLQDNPPGYNGPAGAARDAAWQAYLSQQNRSTTGKVDPKTLVLPNPDAVSDPGLKTLGAAAKQQGVSYAWGGGHVEGKTGVSPGHLNERRDESWTFHDDGRTGFDCSGLTRFATAEGHGFDMGSGNTVFQEGALPGHGAVAIPDSALKPGDLIYYGPPGDSNHVAIYAGNGLMIQAAESGQPVEVSPMRHDRHRNYHIGN